tara:strand:- start:510 stop:809 length:300 start_codon:yes stop_codon:yes gene_type:complete
MDKKTQQILIVAGIAIVGWYLWKRQQDETVVEVVEGAEGMESFSNMSPDKLRMKLEKKCDKKRHANKWYCEGLAIGGEQGLQAGNASLANINRPRTSRR